MEKIADKSKELNTSIVLVNDKLQFKGTVDNNDPISIDYVPPLGDNLGYTSLELLLLSLSSCIGSSILTLLRKKRKNIEGLEMHCKGIRKSEHPTCFETIFVKINLKSPDSTEEDLEKIMKLSEATYCPVWAMMKGNVDIVVSYHITS